MNKRGIFALVLMVGISVFPLTAENNAEKAEIPSGYRDITLGMDLAMVKELLISDPYFLFRGDPDVSMLERPNTSLIECRGASFIDRAFFQFYNERLYIIILVLNRDRIDHFGIYTALTEKYGKPNTFSPQKAAWISDVTEMSLERPLSLKYVDKRVFEELRDMGRAEESLRAVSREEFLKQF